MEALTRSTMSPPKALNSKTTSDQVETSNRKHTQWHVCPSVCPCNTRWTHSSSIGMFTTFTHCRRHPENAFNQKMNQYSQQRLTKQTRNMNSSYDITWTETNILQFIVSKKMWYDARQMTVWLWLQWLAAGCQCQCESTHFNSFSTKTRFSSSSSDMMSSNRMFK